MNEIGWLAHDGDAVGDRLFVAVTEGALLDSLLLLGVQLFALLPQVTEGLPHKTGGATPAGVDSLADFLLCGPAMEQTHGREVRYSPALCATLCMLRILDS